MSGFAAADGTQAPGPAPAAKPIGAIIGGVIGGAALLIIVIFVAKHRANAGTGQKMGVHDSTTHFQNFIQPASPMLTGGDDDTNEMLFRGGSHGGARPHSNSQYQNFLL